MDTRLLWVIIHDGTKVSCGGPKVSTSFLAVLSEDDGNAQ